MAWVATLLNPEWEHLAADWYPDGLILDGKPVK
jgi:hypothetical protein